MNISKISSIVIAASMLTACASAHVSEPSVCDQQTVSFGSVSQTYSVQIGTMELPPATTSFDFSDTIHKVSDIASNLEVVINSFVVDNSSHDMDWIRSVDVKIQSKDGSLPQVDFAHAEFTSPGSDINMNITMNGNDVLRYLQNGPITLTFAMSGDPATVPMGITSLENTITFCVGVNGDVSKSVL